MDLKYLIVPRQFLSDGPELQIANSGFVFWDEFWRDILRENKVEQDENIYDTFLNCDALGLLTYGSEIVAVHLYTFYNLEHSWLHRHPYFNEHRGSVFGDYLKKIGAKTAISYGYLCVHPEWRCKNRHYSFGAIMIGLGAKLQAHLKIDAGLGRCRVDVKTNRKLTELGGVTIEKEYSMHNTPCDFVVMPLDQLRDNPDPRHAQAIHHLWNNREDLTELGFFSAHNQMQISKETTMNQKKQIEEDVKNYLNSQVDLCSKRFREFPWENKTLYCEWLAQTYYFVRHTTAFLALSVARFGVRDAKAQLRALKHLSEEQGHEQLLLQDMRFLKMDIQQRKEYPCTAALYQSQYYWIEHCEPISHLGYALILEGLAAQACETVYDRIKEMYGDKSASFLRAHAKDDPEHFDSALNALDYATEEQLKQIRSNATQTAFLYNLMLEQIVERASNKATKRPIFTHALSPNEGEPLHG